MWTGKGRVTDEAEASSPTSTPASLVGTLAEKNIQKIGQISDIRLSSLAVTNPKLKCELCQEIPTGKLW